MLTSPPPTRILTVSKSGSGTGTVTGADISCGSDCTEDHVNGTSVTLTATADTGSTFTGWSGDCSGTTCTLSMTSNKTAVANFDADTTLPPFTAPNIYLGYADTFFDSTGPTVPTPWAGDPNIVFVGCTTEAECGKYNAGAIMIENPATSTTPLTLVGAYVDIGDPANGGCHYQPWNEYLAGAGQTAQPGQSLILTQTGLNGPPLPAPCREGIDPTYWDFFNFDTSLAPGDNRGFPTVADRHYNCDTALGYDPIITLTFSDGTTLTVTDDDRILNTGGVLQHACLGPTRPRHGQPLIPATSS